MDQRAREVVALLRQLWYGLSAYRLYPGALELGVETIDEEEFLRRLGRG